MRSNTSHLTLVSVCVSWSLARAIETPATLDARTLMFLVQAYKEGFACVNDGA